MGRVFSKKWGRRGIHRQNEKEGDYYEDKGVGEWIILKCIIERQNGVV
jgi:hypothetical protein